MQVLTSRAVIAPKDTAWMHIRCSAMSASAYTVYNAGLLSPLRVADCRMAKVMADPANFVPSLAAAEGMSMSVSLYDSWMSGR